MHFLEVFNCTF